jgi:hypothetical protein
MQGSGVRAVRPDSSNVLVQEIRAGGQRSEYGVGEKMLIAAT